METVNGGIVSESGPPPPSPLTGCYLLIVIGEPHSQDHKDIILRRVAKGLLSWDSNNCMVDLEKELAVITEQAPEGEEARYGERLIQYASENLVTEILIHPSVSTLSQCVRNLLSSFTRHRHIIHSGYTFAANGSWALQDGTFSLADFSEAFQELDVQRVMRAYDNGISVDIHCAPEGDWHRLPKETFAKNCQVRLNPIDVLSSSSPAIANFLNYLSPLLVSLDIVSALESSEVVGNIRFSHPTLYVFPGGQGDAALFGINGFNMLLDGGFSRKACFWDFVRHLDRLDAVLLTRLNNSNVSGITSVLKRKRQNAVYPQIGHFFCNIQERKALLSPDGDKDQDPLLINLLEEGHSIVDNLKHLNLYPQSCYRDSDPINLYHKVGHGTLDMFVLSPAKDSREVREFLQKWNSNDARLFANTKSKDFSFPLPNLVSICALLVWHPSNSAENITRILFPGSTPQTKIFEGLDRLKQLDCIKYPICSRQTLNPPKKAKENIFDSAKPNQRILPDFKKEKSPRISSDIKPLSKDVTPKSDNNKIADTQESKKEIKKSDSTDSDKSNKQSNKIEIKSNRVTPRSKESKSIERKPLPMKADKKQPSPTTPKKTITNGDVKPKAKLSPASTPAKSAKEASNRKVVESKKQAPKAPTTTAKPAEKKEPEKKVERKPISRRPKTAAAPPVTKGSPIRKKPETIAIKKAKLEKEGTTDSSTVSTPTADQDKRDISKLTPEELEQLKAQEMAALKEEQEIVQEIEAVFRKGEQKNVNEPELRNIKNISIEEKTDEEYLIVEKVVIAEEEIAKHTRDSEESEKQRKLSEPKVPQEDAVKEVNSPEEKVDKPESGGATQPDEKFSGTVESGATTAPTLPEDERIPLDEIKEKDDTQAIEEKYVKEETKEKEAIPVVIQLPSKASESLPCNKAPPVVGIRLDKQSHIRDIVKTPDEVADLPVDEVADQYADFLKASNEETNKELKKEAHKEAEIKELKHQIEDEQIKDETKESKTNLKDEKADDKEATNEKEIINKEETKDALLKEETVKETVSEIKKTAAIVKDEINESLEKSKATVKDLVDETKGIKDSIVNATQGIIDSIIKTTDETLIKAHDQVKDIKEQAIEQVEEKKEQAINKSEKIIEDTKQTIDEVKETAPNVAKDIAHTFDTTKNDILDKSSQIIEDVRNETNDAFASAKETTSDAVTSTILKTNESIDNAKNIIDETQSDIKETFEEFLKDTQQDSKVAVSLAEEKGKETVKEKTDSLLGSIDSITKKISEDVAKVFHTDTESREEKVKRIDTDAAANKKETCIVVESVESSENEPVINANDGSLTSACPTTPFDYIDKTDLGRKSPMEREQDVAKIVASVAEVLKSEAPLEDFKGKIPLEITPFPTFTPFTTELRETHITTVDSPNVELPGQITPIKEENHHEILEEMKDEASNNNKSKITDLIKENNDLLEASSKMISDIKSSKQEDTKDEHQKKEDSKESDLKCESEKEHKEIIKETTEVSVKETQKQEIKQENKEEKQDKNAAISKSNENITEIKKELKEVDLKDKKTDVKNDSNKSEEQEATNQDEKDTTNNTGVVRSMLVTASSEDGGEETVICEPGSIIFAKSSESSGRSSPELRRAEVSSPESSQERSAIKKDDISSKMLQEETPEKTNKSDSFDEKKSEPVDSNLLGKKPENPTKIDKDERTETKPESGKSSPAPKDTKVSRPASGKCTPDLGYKDSSSSGRSSPDDKNDRKGDGALLVASSGKASPDISKDSGRAPSSGKTSPELKSDKSSSDIKELQTDTKPSIISVSGKVSPDVIEKDVINLENTTKQVESEKAEVKGTDNKGTPSKIETDLLSKQVDVSDELTAHGIKRKDSIVQETSTGKVDEKNTSGKSTPDVTDTKIPSGKSSPAINDSKRASLQDTEIAPKFPDNKDGKISPLQSEDTKLSEKAPSPITSRKSTPDIPNSINIQPSTEIGKASPILCGSHLENISETTSGKMVDGILSGKTTPDYDEMNNISGKSTPGSAKSRQDSEKNLSSGKSSPCFQKLSNDIENDVNLKKDSPLLHKTDATSGKSTPDAYKLDTDSLASGKLSPTDTGKSIPDKVGSQLDTDSLASGKRDSIHLETDSLASGKLTPETKLDTLDSGKSTPEIIKPKSESPMMEKSVNGAVSPIIPLSRNNSGKSTAESKIDQKEVKTPENMGSRKSSGADFSPDLKGKITPKRESISDGKIIETELLTTIDHERKDSVNKSGKSTPELTNNNILSGKSTPDLHIQTGKSTPDISEKERHLLAGKVTPDINGEKDVSHSGKSTPESKQDVQIPPTRKDSIKIEKNGFAKTPETPTKVESPNTDIIQETETIKSSIHQVNRKESISSTGKLSPELAVNKPDKSTPEVIKTPSTENLHLEKEAKQQFQQSGISTPDLKPKEENLTDKLSPKINDDKSGKTTPDSKQSSGKTSPEVVEKCDKKLEISTSELSKRNSMQAENILSGKSTPEVHQQKRDSMQVEHILSGKSTPDAQLITLDQTKGTNVQLSGQSTPKSDIISTSSAEGERHYSDIQGKLTETAVFDVKNLQSANVFRELMEETIPSSFDDKAPNGDVVHEHHTYLETVKESHSGKSTPDLPRDSRKSSVDDFDSRKFSITSENTKTSSAAVSGKSTPDFKDEFNVKHSLESFMEAERAAGSFSGISAIPEEQRDASSHRVQDPMSASFYGTLPVDENVDLMTSSFLGELPTAPHTSDKDADDLVKSWGKPLGLPSPAPPSNNTGDNKGTPKKERRLPMNVTMKNKLNQRAESPSSKKNKKIVPIYVDLSYVPHHGNSYYSQVDFFRRVRARYYVFSGIEPSKEVYGALLEAKQTWEDKDLEVTIIPTYDTDVLGCWVAENEELLTKYKIDLSPSASRCTINLQDHETSCSAYRLEF